MNKKVLIIIIGLLITVFGLGYLYQTVPPVEEMRIVEMKAKDGASMGQITMSETHAGVLLRLDLSGLTPNGEHAIHIHETGKCDGNFTSSGGHKNPGGHAHGLKHPEGYHAGDMPNLKPDENGNIQTQVMNMKVTLAPESTDKRFTVFDEDGSAIIIHAGADDHMSQPSGAAGDRISCGLIQ